MNINHDERQQTVPVSRHLAGHPAIYLGSGSTFSDMKLASYPDLCSTCYPKAMARTEHTINDALAELLRSTRRAWRDEKVVTSEDTGQLKRASGRPDILVIEPNFCPVVIETEVFPAAIVEAEASSRLTTAYQRIGQLHELAGGDSEAVHAEMMAKGMGRDGAQARSAKENCEDF
jgi:hypothetical protein